MNSTQMLMAAHAAYQAGRLDEARNGLKTLLRASPAPAQAHHLLALVERKRGETAAARAAFARAVAANPSDPEVHNNFGNFLDAEGEAQAAIASYRRAIALKPGFADAHANLGIVALASGDAELAEQSARRAIALNPKFAKAWLVLGQSLRAQENLPAAAHALDQALALQPASPKALATRALIAADRGEPEALARFVTARSANPRDRGLLMAETAARIAAGEANPLDRLAAAVAEDPLWTEGQRTLAKARFEAGEGDAAFSALHSALSTAPGKAALWMTLINLEGATKAGSHMIERVRAARLALGEQPMLDVAEAEFALRAGLAEAARPLIARARDFAAMETTLAEALGRVAARAAIALKDPARAASTLDALRHEQPSLRWDMSLWAHSQTAWRLDNDPRHAWLTEHPGLWAPHDLPIDATELAALASRLRSLHQRKAHPLDQSLRGGSQTEGTLFRREDPEILHLKSAIATAVATHATKLPPPLPGHPTLDPARRAAGWAFTGSWSVRLTGEGFHVAHIHPEGWLSSAFYVLLPEMAGEEGWLILGEPPAELATNLPPLDRIKPQPGRLALFPSWLWHGTRPFRAGERMTVAFDVGLLS